MGGISGLMQGGAYDGVLRWALVMVLIALGAAVLWDYGFMTYLYVADSSHISYLISVIFAAYSVFCLTILIKLGGEWRGLDGAETDLEAGRHPQGSPLSPLVTTYFGDLKLKMLREPGGDRQILLSALANALRKPARAGLYAADLLYKLGMLGTVIGFVQMLGSMDNLQSFEVDNLRKALQQMTGGMATALLTTIAGLVCGILLRMQYNIADGMARTLLTRVVRVSEVALVPEFTREGGDVRD